MRKVDRIFWHTAAHGNPATGEVYDTTAAQIDAWHKQRGWSGIGYNAVIRLGGAIERGRDPEKVPAGVAGLNRTTYHICFSGHGDIQPLTLQQLESGVRHTIELLRQYGLVEPFLTQPDALIVLGHREVNHLIDRGLADVPRVSKTCPGRLVNMDSVRAMIRRRLTESQRAESTAASSSRAPSQTESTFQEGVGVSESALLLAFRVLYAAAESQNWSRETVRLLNQLRHSPEVASILGKGKQSGG